MTKKFGTLFKLLSGLSFDELITECNKAYKSKDPALCLKLMNELKRRLK